MKKITVKVTYLTPILGTTSGNPELHDEFIASKAPDAKSREEEIAAIGVDEAVEKSMTLFPRENGKPFVWDYQWKGFFKDTCAALQRMKGEKCAKESCGMKAYKKIIDGCIFVYPRKIMFDDFNGEMETLQRPLRASTAQGERIALANSEMIHEGTSNTFYIETPDTYEDAVYEWLNHGNKRGMLQWRNAGYGRFTYEVLLVEDI